MNLYQIYHKIDNSNGTIYLYSGYTAGLWPAVPIATYSVDSDAGTGYWMDSNGTDEIYLSGETFMALQKIGGAYTYRITATDIRQIAYNNGWVYYEVESTGLLYRYKFSTSVTETWDGIDATEVKSGYITTTLGGPSPDDLMRCRKWFSGGTFQGCYIG